MHDIGIKIIEMLNQYVTLNEITLFVLQRSVGFMLVIGASIATERILRNIILDKQIRNLNKVLEMSLGIKKQNKFFSRMKGLNLFHKSIPNKIQLLFKMIKTGILNQIMFPKH